MTKKAAPKVTEQAKLVNDYPFHKDQPPADPGYALVPNQEDKYLETVDAGYEEASSRSGSEDPGNRSLSPMTNGKKPSTNRVFKDEDSLKKYLKRRQNNNAAACKSRQKKKELEMQNVERANRLEAENLKLRNELQKLEFEAKYLKEVLQNVLSNKVGNSGGGGV
jgi:hypothetical protein